MSTRLTDERGTRLEMGIAPARGISLAQPGVMRAFETTCLPRVRAATPSS